MSDTWTRERCPHCNAQNWINHGDVSDITGLDIEACKCWECEKKFLLGDPDETKDVHFFDIEECCGEEGREYKTVEDFVQNGAVCEWGRKNPSEPYRSCR